MERGEEYEVDEEQLLAHAQMLGRNRMPPPDLHGSTWYVGPFPTLQMVSALYDSADAGADEGLDSSLEEE